MGLADVDGMGWDGMDGMDGTWDWGVASFLSMRRYGTYCVHVCVYLNVDFWVGDPLKMHFVWRSVGSYGFCSLGIPVLR